MKLCVALQVQILASIVGTGTVLYGTELYISDAFQTYLLVKLIQIIHLLPLKFYSEY